MKLSLISLVLSLITCALAAPSKAQLDPSLLWTLTTRAPHTHVDGFPVHISENLILSPFPNTTSLIATIAPFTTSINTTLAGAKIWYHPSDDTTDYWLLRTFAAKLFYYGSTLDVTNEPGTPGDWGFTKSGVLTLNGVAAVKAIPKVGLNEREEWVLFWGPDVPAAEDPDGRGVDVVLVGRQFH